MLGLNFNRADFLIGLVLGGVFVILNVVGAKFVIGIPEIQSIAETGQAMVIGGVAPVVEELFFKFGVYGVLTTFLGLAALPAVLVASTAFMLFHFYAYGASFVNSGLLIGAFIFSVASFVVAIKRQNILPAIVAHAVFNTFLLSQLVIVL